MGKSYYKHSTPEKAPVKGEAKASDVLQTYSFPEHGVSIQAVDMQDAILKLNVMLKQGGK